jgi:hypothetical protein
MAKTRVRASWSRIVAATLLLSLCACGESEDPRPGDAAVADGPPTSHDGLVVDGPGPGCAIEPSGKPGSVSVAIGAPTTLDNRDAKAMNTLDHEHNGQLAAAAYGALRVGPCGDVGLVMRLASGGDAKLVYLDPTSSSVVTEEIEPNAGKSHDASLFFDDSCSPLVLRGSLTTGYVEYRKQAGSWTAVTLQADFSTELGAAASSLRHIGADVGADGKLYVFASAEAGGKKWLLRGERASGVDASWAFSALPAPPATQLYALRVDAQGTTHALLRNTASPCDPCNVDLLHGRFAAGDSAWTVEVVQAGKWGAPNDELVEAADLAFAADGSALIAAHFVTRVVTGSYASAELRLYGKVAGSYCHQSVVLAVDVGYVGGDGAGFTGADPQILRDAGGRLHVLFRDQSIWHDAQGMNEMRGQLRYALRAGDAWTVRTLYSQQGQLASANPLKGMGQPLLAISEDGKKVVATGVDISWKTGSVYNQSEQDASYAAKAIVVDVGAP